MKAGCATTKVADLRAAGEGACPPSQRRVTAGLTAVIRTVVLVEPEPVLRRRRDGAQ